MILRINKWWTIIEIYMNDKVKKYLKLIIWIKKFNEYCFFLGFYPELSFNDLIEFYNLGWDPGVLAGSLCQ